MDLKSSVHSQNGGMKISRGAFDVNCSTTKDPAFVMTEMFRSLDANHVQYRQVSYKDQFNIL